MHLSNGAVFDAGLLFVAISKCPYDDWHSFINYGLYFQTYINANRSFLFVMADQEFSFPGLSSQVGNQFTVVIHLSNALHGNVATAATIGLLRSMARLAFCSTIRGV